MLVTGIGAAVVLGSLAVLMVAAAFAGLLLIGRSATRAHTPFESTIARVAELPLFAGASGASLEAALERLVAVPVRAGETVIRQGEAADRFYIIESGTFSVTQEGPTAASPSSVDWRRATCSASSASSPRHRAARP